ncbi:zinc finger homeobox protein 3-like [Arapaima gigas]
MSKKKLSLKLLFCLFQDESGETDVDIGTLAWLCPLCQEKQMNREQLALHLTHRHSVLPACLDRLLDPVSVNLVTLVVQDFSLFLPATQQTHVEISTTQPAPSEGTSTLSRESEFKMVGQPEKNNGGQERDLEGTEFNLNSDDERTQLPNLYESLDDVLGTTEKNNLTPVDLALEKNVNPIHPFKCNMCLESFTFRSELSVHYRSATHLHRMQKVCEQGSDKDSFNSPISSPQSDLFQPYISSKPYKCAVCRVSYNHAITLESHLKSVLHQTWSRNAGNSASSIADKSGSRSSRSSGTNTTAINCAASSRSSVAPSLSVTDSSSSTQGGLSAVTRKTKDGEQLQSHAALSVLSSPVASAQPVSTFLTLLPSTSHSSLMPSLIAANAGASPITTAPQLISPQQLVLPLFLNGLQTPVLESSSHILAQSVSVLDVNAVRQSLLTQRLGLQNPELGVDVSSLFSSSEKDKTFKTGSGVDKVIMEQNSRVNIEDHDNVCRTHAVNAEEVINNEEEQRKCPEVNSTLNSGKCESESKDLLNNKIRETEETSRVNKTKGDGSGEHIKECDKVGRKTDVDQPNLPAVQAEGGCLDFRMSQPKNAVSLSLDSDTSFPIKSHTNTSLNVHPTDKLTSDFISNQLKCCSKLPTVDKTNLIKTSQDSDANVKPSSAKSCPLMLSEFQSQVLWAFLESRSEVDVAGSPMEDCEALAREVGLTEGEVCTWLQEAREAKERQKEERTVTSGFKAVSTETDAEGIYESMNVLPEENKVDLQTLEGGETALTTNHENCLTSESDNEEFYTAVIVTDEESQNSPLQDEQSSSVKQALAEERTAAGGKGFWSTTVFLSDPEDEDDDGEESKDLRMKKKRKTSIEIEELNTKREKLDPDIDLELEAQTDSPPPPTFSQQQDVPRINTIGTHPLSLALTPFTTHFFSPSILSLPPSVRLEIPEGVGDPHKGNSTIFSKLPDTHPFLDPIKVPAPASCAILPESLPCQGNYESALDLSVGKNYTAASASLTPASTNKSIAQPGLVEGCGIKPTNTGGLIVVRVKPNTTLGVPISNYGGVGSGTNNNSLNRKAADRLSTTVKEMRSEKTEDEAKRIRNTKPRRLRDMRRSRTIIQAEQLDVLYGCYFKDPNPGKQEFEQISEWVHLPKRVVQIWFQNMRARERKGEVRFLGDGTLAAVGKPLIKFTWPLKKPILSNISKSNTSLGGSQPSRLTAEAEVTKSIDPCRKTSLKTELKKEKEAPVYRNGASSSFSKSNSLISKMEPQTPAPKVKSVPKVSSSCLQAVKMEACSSYLTQRNKRENPFDEVEENHTDEEDESERSLVRPGSINRMVPKLSFTHLRKLPGPESQKHNGLNISPKRPFKINTLSRDQLGLTTSSTAMSGVTSTTPTVSSSHKMKNPDCSQHSTPRRPRTLLTNLQLAILQSCYETCSHPHALECEAVGSELGLPLKVVQIWFQNTRAKEKRWRLQQEKEVCLANSNSVDLSSASYLQYSALRANRPILPKPVQLTVLEPSTSPALGQPASQEILRGRCLVCDTGFDSRAAARVHVFSLCHLAMLKATNFGQSPSAVSQGSSTVSSSPMSSPSSKKVIS